MTIQGFINRENITKEIIYKLAANGIFIYQTIFPHLRRKDDSSFHNIRNVFRRDRNPSLLVYKWRDINSWRHKDFGDPTCHGDCFDMAALYYKLDIKNDFRENLRRLYDDLRIEDLDKEEVLRFINTGIGQTDIRPFNLQILPKERLTVFENNLIQDKIEESQYSVELLKKEYSQLSNLELEFLTKTGIKYDIMNEYDSYFISGYKKLFNSGKTEFIYTYKNQIWIAYRFNGFCKIYCPSPKKFFFIGKKNPNSKYIFGMPQITYGFQEATYAFITAGEKDALALLSRGIPAISLNSETASLTKNDLRSWYYDLGFSMILVYDIDETGKKKAKELHESLRIKYITLPSWLSDKGGKDVTDFFLLGGTIEELNSLVDATIEKEKIDVPIAENRLSIRTAAQRLEDAKGQPDILPYADVLFQSNELVIFFGDTGKGKSILAVALADAISKGQSFLGLENKCGPSIVAYYDFELSDKQFQKRYSDENNIPYRFSNGMYIDNMDFSNIDLNTTKNSFEELLINKIKDDLRKVNAKVIIIDNITFLTTYSAEDGQVAMKLMKLLKSLKTEEQVSILVLAHTPKRFGVNGISLPDLAGSKHLSNFADSVMALGASKKDPNMRYIIQVKASRTGEVKYDSDNVIICEIQKIGSFLSLVFRGHSKEQEHLSSNNDEVESEMIERAKELHKQGKTIRDIANEIGLVSKSTVGRWLKNENDSKS